MVSAYNMERTYVYIDSFNLYYGILKQKLPGYKWLDIHLWLSKLLPLNQYDIQKIKYFTAGVSATTDDPQKPIRQNTYFRALKTISTLELIKGAFLFKWTRIHVTKDVSINARVSEEKGTDVNIATHSINDGHKGLYDTAVIVSNDSDLSDVVRIITQELGLKVVIINPCLGMGFSKQLTKYATEKKRAREAQITTSQFPVSLTDSVGKFTKPPTW